MLSKSACLASTITTTTKTRLFFARTKLVNSLTTKLTSNKCNSTKALFKSPPPLQLLSLTTKFTTSSCIHFNKTQDKKPSIIQSTPTQAAASPLISDDLKKILNAQIGSENDDKQQQQENSSKNSSSNDNDGDLISKEKAWKYTKYMYIAFTGWMGCFCVYLLHEWGKPRVDEASQIPVSVKFFFFF